MAKKPRRKTKKLLRTNTAWHGACFRPVACGAAWWKRHTFSGAISYDIPALGNGIWTAIFSNWSTDSIVYARSAPTINLVTGQNPFGGFL